MPLVLWKSRFLAIPKTNWRKSGSKREDLVKNAVFSKDQIPQSLIQTKQLILRNMGRTLFGQE